MRGFQRKKRKNSIVQLTVISLMDIFTILLLFLLVQLGDTGIALPSTEHVRLPSSTTRDRPKSTIQITMTNEAIFVEGKRVMTVEEALEETGLLLSPVADELGRLTQRTKALNSMNPSVKFHGNVTFLGDKKIPFKLLKKMMHTSAKAGYPNVSLGVMQKDNTA